MKNLVIITAGRGSKHVQFENLKENCNFDLAMIIYDQTEFNDLVFKNAKFIEYNKGWKWVLISEFLEKYNLEEYDYVMFMDDDVEISKDNLNNYFLYLKENNITLGQPALTTDSYWSHSATLVRGNAHRKTNTIEIMCPTFANHVLNESMSFLKIKNLRNNIFGLCWNLELVFEDFLTDHHGNVITGGIVAIVDKFPMKHTKPVGISYKGLDATSDIKFYEKYLNYNLNLNRGYFIKEI